MNTNKWLARFPRPRGCNYIPACCVNPIDFWRAESFPIEVIERELSWVAAIGLNSVRVFLHDLVWMHDPEGFLGRFDHFLTVASAQGVSCLPVVFDDCWDPEPLWGPQPDPIPGVHNSRWVTSPARVLADSPGEWGKLERYVAAFLRRFGADERIIGWDLYNEPGNAMHPDPWREKPELRGERALPLLRAVHEWARSTAPRQPLTVGCWRMSPEMEALNSFQLDHSDVLSFHCYGGADALGTLLETHRRPGKPVWVTEWLARSSGSTVEAILPAMRASGAGWYCWGLVAGATQTFQPWGSPRNAPESEPWHHDLLRPDGSAYDPREIELLVADSKRV